LGAGIAEGSKASLNPDAKGVELHFGGVGDVFGKGFTLGRREPGENLMQ
jgi:hypothetical protein